MLIPALIISTVVAAFLARVALLRWTDCRSWSFARTVITWALIVNTTGFTVLMIACLYEWIEQNGFALRGICPGGPPDIPPHPCIVSEHVASYLDPFALAGVAVFLLVWTLLWCAVWCAASLFEHCPAERSRLRHVLRAFAAGASAWLLATVIGLLTVVVAVQVYKASWRRPAAVISARDFLRAWALPVRLEKVKQKDIELPARKQNAFWASVAVPEGDAVRALGRWPKHCWQSPSELPSGSSEPVVRGLGRAIARRI